MQNDTTPPATPKRPVARPVLRPTSIDEEIRNRRTLVVIAVVFIIGAALPVLFFTTPIVPGITPLLSVLPAVVVYLLLGTLFSMLLTTRLGFLYRLGSNAAVGYTAAVWGLSMVLIAGTSYLRGGFSVAIVLLYGCCFILPFTILQTWLYYKAIATPLRFPLFYLPPPGTETVAVTVFLNSLNVQVRLAALPNEPEHVYEAVVPGRLTVGEMFSFFLKEKQDSEGHAFPFNDIISNHYGWQFFTTTLAGMGLRQLNPDESLIDNGVADKSTIIIRRAQAQLPAQGSNPKELDAGNNELHTV